MNHKCIRNLSTIVAIGLLFCSQAWTQEFFDARPASPQALTGQIEDVKAHPDLTETEREKLLADLQTATRHSQATEQYEARTLEINNSIQNAPQRIAHFEQRLNDSAAESHSPDVGGGSPEQIESRISLAEAERRSLAERRSEILAEINDLPMRTTVIQDRLGELRSRIEQLRSVLDTPLETLEQRISQLANRLRLQAWIAEEESLEAELLSQPTREQVRVAERGWINLALGNVDRKLEMLAAAAEKARAVTTAQELKNTDALVAELEQTDPRVQKFAATNRQLAEQLLTTAEQTDSARKEGAILQEQLELIEKDAHLMNRRLGVAGRKEVLGQVMMSRLESLPDTASLKHGIKQRNMQIASTSLTHINTDEELRNMAQRRKYIGGLIPGLSSWEDKPREVVEQLVDQRLELLADNLQGLGNLVRLQVDNNVTADQLIEETRAFNDFLIGNLLWVRNFDFISIATLQNQLTTFFSGREWSRLPTQIANGLQNSVWSTMLLVLFIPFAFLSIRLRPLYRNLLGTPTPLSAERVWNTVLGMVLSILLVAPWPFALYLLGAVLGATEPKMAFLSALAPAILTTAKVLFVLLLVRLMVAPLGVGRRFLKWDTRMLEALRAELEWAGPVMIVATFIEAFALNLDVVASGGPLGAFATLIAAATVIIMGIRLLQHEVLREDRMVSTLLRVTVLLGAVVILLELLGLLFAAKMYLQALGLSLTLLLVVKTLSDVMERWLLIIRARLERKTKDEIRALEEEGEDSIEEQEELADVASLSEAHTKLLSLARLVAFSVALWLIWSPSLPAFNLLDQITLWEVVDSSSLEGGQRAITLFDLTIGVFIIVITALVAKHISSLVQLFLLEWMNISAGARYANSILLQYLVIAIGGSMFLSIVGWDWSRVQWLVAALGVGIGFGLQEIVANFISGIIILFERPIRVGDIISAGGAEGTVLKINPRATVIETFDRKEHLIPNKELITGHVINWTLSENALRLVIPVGVAYGSDVRKAMSLLLEAAVEVELVRDDPPPRATFEDFGDNSLLLWLRCFTGAEDRPVAWTELRARINDKFTEAGIVISFPQRDVHLDVKGPLRVEMASEKPSHRESTQAPATIDGST